MSKILANQIANYLDNAPIEIKEGLNIPTGKPLQVNGSVGTSGQVLSTDGSGLVWADAPYFNGNYNSLSNKPTIPDPQVSSDWNVGPGDVRHILNKPTIPPQPSVTTASPSGSGSLTYNTINGTFTYTPPDFSSYVVAETDPVFLASPAGNITETNKTNWNTAYGWGDHTAQGYITLTNISAATVAPSGGGSLAYDNTSGIFTLTPPDLSGYLTSESDTLDSITDRGNTTTNDITVNDLTVSGNLTVIGTTTSTNVGTLNVSASEIVINDGQTGAPTLNGSLKNERGDEPDTRIRWNEGTDIWEFTNDGVTYNPIPTNTNQLTNGAGFLTSYTETDPVFLASPAGGITNASITNWNAAYGWGDHSTAGYLTVEADTLDTITARGNTTNNGITVGGITVNGNMTVNGTQTIVNTSILKVSDNEITLNNDVTNVPTENAGIEVERGLSTNVRIRWDESVDRWQFTNNGSNYYNLPIAVSELSNDSGYITGYVETDPIFSASAASSITSTELGQWNAAYNWGDHAAAGYLTSLGAAENITLTKISNWDTAYSWGDHSQAGYLTSYTETQTLDDVLSLGSTTTQDITTTGKVYFSNNFATTGDLPDASTYHGMFAHVHAEGHGYFAHAGAWTQLLDSGSELGDLANVNLATTPQSGQLLAYDGANWVATTASAGGGGGSGIALTDLSVSTNTAGTAALSYNNVSGVFTFTPPDLSGYLTSYTETDPVFVSHPASSVTAGNISDWNTAYSWGDHTAQGYLTSISSLSIGALNDVQIGSSGPSDGQALVWSATDSAWIPGTVSGGGGESLVSQSDIDNWNTAFSWGDHSTIGYLQSISSETIGALSDVNVAGVTDGQILKWNSTSNQWLAADESTGGGDSVLTLDDVTANGSTTANGIDVGSVTSTGQLQSRQGSVIAGQSVGGFFTGGSLSHTGGLTITNRTVGGNLLDIGHYGNSNTQYKFVVDWNANTTIDGSLTAGGLTYPTTNGTAGQILTSDGAGNVTWGSGGGQSISESDILNWNEAYSWGDHSQIGYLQSISSETIGALSDVNVAGVTNGQALIYDNSTSEWVPGSIAETDPVFSASDAAGISQSDILNWDDAYGWGNHALIGYLQSISSESIGALSDVNTSNVADGQVLKWNAATSEWLPADDNDTIGGGGSTVTIDDGAPNSPSAGDLWWNSAEGALKIYYDDGDTSQWVDASPSGSGATGGATGATYDLESRSTGVNNAFLDLVGSNSTVDTVEFAGSGGTVVNYNANTGYGAPIITIDSPLQVQADWNETDNTDPSFILNKPAIVNPSIDSLVDTNINASGYPLQGGDHLVYDSATAKWVNLQYAQGLSTTKDVYVGANLTINATTQDNTLTFTNGAGTYAGITDNSASTGTDGQVLTADGNGGLNWETPAPPDLSNYLTSSDLSGISIGVFSDVDTPTTPTPGEVLKWNGTAWAPAADATGGGGGGTPGGNNEEIQYNSSGGFAGSSSLKFIDVGGSPTVKRLQVGDNPGDVAQTTVGEILTDNINAQGNISALTGGYFGGTVQIEGNSVGTSLQLLNGSHPVSITDNNNATGTAGQVLSATGDDGSGNATGVAWTTPSGLSSRQTTSAQTASIADGASDDILIAAAKAYGLISIETSAAAWVTLYVDAASRTADASRSENTDAIPGTGVIAEVITTGAATQLMTPGVFGFNNDTVPTTNVYAKVVNKSGGTSNITVTLKYVPLEA